MSGDGSGDQPEPGADVFLTYTRADERVAERLARRLRLAGFEPWFDRADIEPGDSWVQSIDIGLRRAEHCLVLIGTSVRSGWAAEELAAAMDLALDPGDGHTPLRVTPVLLPGVPEQNGTVDRSAWPSWLRTRQWVDLRAGPEDDEAWEDLLDALSDAPRHAATEAACPYPGLMAFTEDDSDRFVGREDELAALITRVRNGRFLAVTGASGSGKSSVVRAGLVPEIRRNAPPGSPVRIVVTRPRDDAWGWLRSALIDSGVCNSSTARRVANPGALREFAVDLAPTGELVVVVDQLEELFAQPCQLQREFVAELLSLSVRHGPARVIVTLRADFLGAAAELPDLAMALSDHQYILAPLTGTSLRRAIEQPAHDAGLEFHAGLVDRIVRDVEAEPGSLPLLAHTLRKLFEARRRNRLTLPAYEALGGVGSTLATTADEVIDALSESDQNLARRILLRLTRPGDGTEDARVPADFDELITSVSETEAVARVVDALATGRLVVVDEHPGGAYTTVDVSHEALLRAWPRLRRWIAEHRDLIRRQQSVMLDQRAWTENGEDPSYLYQGARLEQAAELLSSSDAFLNLAEQRFLRASLEDEERRLTAIEKGRERDAARSAQLRLRTRLFVVAALVAIIVAGLAVVATLQARRAERSEQAAQAAELAAASSARLDGERDQSLLLAAEAASIDPTSGTVSAVIDALAQPPVPDVILSDLPSSIVAADATVAADDSSLIAAGTTSGNVHVVAVENLPVGVATATGDVHQLHRPGPVAALSWTDRGRLVSGGGDGRVVILDPASGEENVLWSDGPEIVDVAVLGDLVAAADRAGVVRVWNDNTEVVLEESVDAVSHLEIGPDGRTLVVAAGAQVLAFDLAAPTDAPSLAFDGAAAVTALGVDRLSNSLAVGDSSGRIDQIYLDDGSVRGVPMRTSFGSIRSIRYGDSGGEVVASTDRRARVVRWNADTGEQLGTPFSREATGPEQERLSELRIPIDPLVGAVPLAHSEVVTASRSAVVRWDLRAGAGLVDRTWQTAGSTRWVTWQEDTPRSDPAVGDAFVSGPVTATAFDRDGELIAVGSDLGEFSVRWAGQWSAGQVSGSVTAVAVGSDGVVAVAAQAPAPTLQLWRVGDAGMELKDESTDVHAGSIDSLAWHPNAPDTLLSGSDDRTIRRWDTAGSRLVEVARIDGHTDRIRGLAFTPDGRTLVSGSEDSTVRFWSFVDDLIALGQPVDVGSPVLAVAPADNGVLVAYGEEIERWRLDLTTSIERACNLAGRDLSDDEMARFLGSRMSVACTPGS